MRAPRAPVSLGPRGHNLGLNKILGTIHPYPTMSEGAKYTAGVWKQAHAPQKLLAWVKKYHHWMRN